MTARQAQRHRSGSSAATCDCNAAASTHRSSAILAMKLGLFMADLRVGMYSRTCGWEAWQHPAQAEAGTTTVGSSPMHSGGIPAAQALSSHHLPHLRLDGRVGHGLLHLLHLGSHLCRVHSSGVVRRCGRRGGLAGRHATSGGLSSTGSRLLPPVLHTAQPPHPCPSKWRPAYLRVGLHLLHRCLELRRPVVLRGPRRLQPLGSAPRIAPGRAAGDLPHCHGGLGCCASGCSEHSG